MMEVQQLHINSRYGAYDVTIANGSLSTVAALPLLRGRHVVVVSSPPVLERWGPALLRDFPKETTQRLLHDDGETAKTPRGYSNLLSSLALLGTKRDSILVALGGGVTGDLAGFAAATYMRGIGYINVPTTLLAQVDSSIGGKTGINLPEGKNLAGCFYPPLAVITDPLVLNTLSKREFSSGLYECIKCAILGDAALFALLMNNRDAILNRDPEIMAQVIYATAAVKARIVNADEFEKGERALLNFGHTFGHALEAALGYGLLKHGEAVAWGMTAAIYLSCVWADLPQDQAAAMQKLISSFGGLPSFTVSEKEVLERMDRDKKHTSTAQQFILTSRLGTARVLRVPRADVRLALREMLREARV